MKHVTWMVAVIALSACATAEHPSDKGVVAATTAGVYLTYSNPDSAGSSDVSVKNDTASAVSIRYERVVHNGSAQPTQNSMMVPAYGKEWVGRTCAFDVQYQTVCGSQVTYKLL